MRARFLIDVVLFCICFTAFPTSLTSSVWQTCNSTSGVVQDITYFSEILGEDMVYSAYLPPCYNPDSDTLFPTLYLMHGSNADNTQWLQLGIDAHLDRAI